MITLVDSIRAVRGVGPELARKLSKAEIGTIRDLICLFPKSYEDWHAPVPIGSLRPGKDRLIRARIRTLASDTSSKHRRPLLQALLEDSSGLLEAVWFGQGYLANLLAKQSTWLFRGLVTRRHGRLQLVHPAIRETEGLIPSYPQIQGIRSRTLETLIRSALSELGPIKSSISPNDLRKRHLIDPSLALREIHLPRDLVVVGRAHRSLAFFELVRFAHKIQTLLTRRQTLRPPRFTGIEPKLEYFIDQLPFILTPDQATAIDEILATMRQPHPMRFLLQGDVGTGKTAVAAAASFWAAQRGLRVVWLVPTEILARQHASHLADLMKPVGLTVGVWTGRDKTRERCSLSVGTHALLYRTRSDFQDVGLVVIDEQHRFGVRQRQQIEALTDQPTASPHILMMSATPIPRTLASLLFGLHSSATIRSRPAGRVPVTTELIGSAAEERRMWKDLKAVLGAGEQVYVIVPTIHGRATDALPNELGIEERLKEVRNQLPDAVVEVLHGQLVPQERQRVMQEFLEGTIDVLVATTVIEVGVDVPNATRIVIWESHRFGLAQLHQLRGRVGRGNRPSRCYLSLPNQLTDQEVRKRLKYLATQSDGLKLAEYDLARRGPGDVFGVDQSGKPVFRFGDFMDIELFHLAQDYLKEKQHHAK